MAKKKSVDHDQRLKTLIKNFLHSFCVLFLKGEQKIDWSVPPEWLANEAFLDPPRGERRTIDLAAKVRLKEPIPVDNRANPATSAFVIVHIEIESGDSGANMGRRMHEYWNALQHHDLPILPIVLFLSVGYDGVGEVLYERWFYDWPILRYSYLRIGLPGLNAADYLYHSERLGAVLSLWMRNNQPRAELVAEVQRRIADGPDDNAHKYLLFETSQAYANLRGSDLRHYRELLETEELRGVKAMNQTSFEKGEKRGIEQGREQGIEQGKREVAIRLLRRKFGSLPREATRAINAMSKQQLETLCDRLLDANSLADLGLVAAGE